MSMLQLFKPVRFDYLVGLRFLLSATYRQRVQQRWRQIPRFEKINELAIGLLSILFLLALAASLLGLVVIAILRA